MLGEWPEVSEQGSKLRDEASASQGLGVAGATASNDSQPSGPLMRGQERLLPGEGAWLEGAPVVPASPEHALRRAAHSQLV